MTEMPEGWYAVTNEETGVGFGLRFPADVFPYLWYWRNLGGGWGYPWYGRRWFIVRRWIFAGWVCFPKAFLFYFKCEAIAHIFPFLDPDDVPAALRNTWNAKF